MKRVPLTAFALASLAVFAHVPLVAQVRSGAVQITSAGSPVPSATRNVLLIGNSLTYFNEMPWILGRVAASLTAHPRIYAEFCGRNGMTLKQHWEDGNARKRLHEKQWDVVVVQAQSTEAVRDSATFRRYAMLLLHEIKVTGAQPVIFLTWAPKGLSYTQRQFDDAYLQVAHETGAEIAPIGIAWHQLLSDGIELFDGSGAHPNLAGSYLAACVLFATVYGRSPEGAVYSFDVHFDIPEFYRRSLEQEHLSSATAAKIQRAAWNAVNHH